MLIEVVVRQELLLELVAAVWWQAMEAADNVGSGRNGAAEVDEMSSKVAMQRSFLARTPVGIPWPFFASCESKISQ